MKKRLLLFTFIIATSFLLTGCTRTITYEKMKQMIDNKETFIVEIIQDDCSYCEKFTPIFEKFTKDNNITYYKINISNMDDNNYNRLNSKYSIQGTPTVIFIRDGKELTDYRITGNKTSNELKTIFENAGYLK